jgi:hypothetical protein
MSHKTKWWIMAPLGLVLTGFGLSLLGEAVMMKYEGKPTMEWFLWGTLSLVVFNSGLSIFGGAIIHRFKHLNQKKS